MVTGRPDCEVVGTIVAEGGPVGGPRIGPVAGAGGGTIIGLVPVDGWVNPVCWIGLCAGWSCVVTTGLGSCTMEPRSAPAIGCVVFFGCPPTTASCFPLVLRDQVGSLPILVW